LPVVFQVEEATKEKPYFGCRLNLDASLVASVMMESGFETKKGDAGIKALSRSGEALLSHHHQEVINPSS
jgi:hypothetical protein